MVMAEHLLNVFIDVCANVFIFFLVKHYFFQNKTVHYIGKWHPEVERICSGSLQLLYTHVLCRSKSKLMPLLGGGYHTTLKLWMVFRRKANNKILWKSWLNIWWVFLSRSKPTGSWKIFCCCISMTNVPRYCCLKRMETRSLCCHFTETALHNRLSLLHTSGLLLIVLNLLRPHTLQSFEEWNHAHYTNWLLKPKALVSC